MAGRLKELIIKGGENIAPREIDEAILKHPGVLDAAAVGIPDANYGQEIMVCIVLKRKCAHSVSRNSENSERPRSFYLWKIYHADLRVRYSVSSYWM
nr:hypothetical protein [Polynucleobacter necessarius]